MRGSIEEESLEKRGGQFPSNFIFIGMPFAGKSTIGKALSEKIEYTFVDTDTEIEKKEGISIPHLFQEKGEVYFREKERELVQSLLGSQHQVLATGGGMPIYHQNLEQLKTIGFTIFLKVPFLQLLERAKKAENRPLLQAEKESSLKKLYEERIKIYAKAHCCIATEGKNIAEICEEILQKWREYDGEDNNICKCD